MAKFVKNMMIKAVSNRVGDCKDVLVVDSSRMDAITNNRFRVSLREKGVEVFSVRNSLARLALNAKGVDSLDSVLSGASTLVWGGEDVVALSKEVAKWAEEVEELEVRGGTVEGEVLSPEGVVALSKSPSRLELIGKIAGLALSPGANVAGALLGPAGTIAGQVKTISEKDGE